MAIILTDETALAFWRRSGITGSNLFDTQRCRLPRIPPGAPSDEEAAAACDQFVDDGDPIRVLVANKNDFRRSERIRFSAFSQQLPNRALRRLNKDLYVTGPEFTFVRLAARLPLVPLVCLGFSMTGVFAPNENDTRGFSTCMPLLSTQALTRFINDISGVYGLVQARKALPHILDGAASPMEAELAMLLTLPRRLGGYGLPKPKLNYALDTGTTRGSRLSRKTIVVDAAWPEARLALEYDSDRFHTGAEKIAADSERRNDIAFLGYAVKTITRKELASVSSFDLIAHSVARHLGKRIRIDANDFPNRRTELRRTLMQVRAHGLSPFLG